MIINKIRLQEKTPMAAGSTIYELPICDLALDSSAGNNGYFIKVADGLGPPNISAVVEGFDNSGISILGSRSQKRLIALRVQLKPGIGQSYSSLRDVLYRYMSRAVTLNFMHNAIERARVHGYISNVDVSLFTNQPDIQLTILCDTGELFAPMTTDIPFGTLNTSSPVINYNNGTAPTGMNLKFTVTANTANFTISNHARVWHAGDSTVNTAFTITYNFLVGDVVTISTNPKDKRVLLTRSLVNYDLAGYINSGAVWPQLYPGVNVFNWTLASSWLSWTEANYLARFWGI